jgi:hypothetical protein
VAVDRVVDSVHWSMMDRANGDNPDLIWGVGFAMDDWGGPRAAGGGARPETAAARRSIAGVRSISSYRAPFRVRFGPGGREG